MKYNNREINFEEERDRDSKKELIYEDLKSMGSDMGKRLELLRRENKLSQVEFFESIEYEQLSANASKILNKLSNGTKDILFLKKVAETYDVSINWLVGNLPLDIRQDSYYNIYNHTGLSQKNIDMLFKYNVNHQAMNQTESEIKGIMTYLELINNILSDTYFTILLEDCRNLAFNNLEKSKIKKIESDIVKDVIDTYGMIEGSLIVTQKSKEKYLLDKVCEDFRKIIKSIYNIKED